jgi:hypothetical protein
MGMVCVRRCAVVIKTSGSAAIHAHAQSLLVSSFGCSAAAAGLWAALAHSLLGSAFGRSADGAGLRTTLAQSLLLRSAFGRSADRAGLRAALAQFLLLTSFRCLAGNAWLLAALGSAALLRRGTCGASRTWLFCTFLGPRRIWLLRCLLNQAGCRTRRILTESAALIRGQRLWSRNVRGRPDRIVGLLDVRFLHDAATDVLAL